MGHQRARDLDEALVRKAQRAHLLVERDREAEIIENFLDAPQRVRLALVAAPQAEEIKRFQRDLRMHSDQDIFQHGEILDQLDRLERPADAARGPRGSRHGRDIRAAKNDAAVGRGDDSRNRIEQRRFPGAVRPDQAADLALAQLHRDILDSVEAAEPDSHAFEFEDRLHARYSAAFAEAPACRRSDACSRQPGAARISRGSRPYLRSSPAMPDGMNRMNSISVSP